jgi:predicted RNase H-like HicB family nuclease
MQLTAVYVETPDGVLAFVEELQGAATRGTTLDEARENLRQTVQLVLDQNRDLAEGTLGLANLPYRKEEFPLAAL